MWLTLALGPHGVFAFAITLMILAIRIPHRTDADAGLGLLKLLTQQWTGYLAFVLSFIFVGMNWSNHRVIFSKFVRTDHTFGSNSHGYSGYR